MKKLLFAFLCSSFVFLGFSGCSNSVKSEGNISFVITENTLHQLCSRNSETEATDEYKIVVTLTDCEQTTKEITTTFSGDIINSQAFDFYDIPIGPAKISASFYYTEKEIATGSAEVQIISGKNNASIALKLSSDDSSSTSDGTSSDDDSSSTSDTTTSGDNSGTTTSGTTSDDTGVNVSVQFSETNPVFYTNSGSATLVAYYNGQEISGITYTGVLKSNGQEVSSGYTFENGTFTVTDLAAGEYTLEITATCYGVESTAVISLIVIEA